MNDLFHLGRYLALVLMVSAVVECLRFDLGPLVQAGKKHTLPPKKPEIRTLEEFNEFKHSLKGLKSVRVIGNTSSVSDCHPTIKFMMYRWLESNSVPGKRSAKDNERIALCIEGGGMRGSVCGGAVAALGYLGLDDTVDIVYGSSAGAMIGAYFISKQHDATNIYFDILTKAKHKFIDKRNLLSAAGIPANFAISTKSLQSLLSKLPIQRLLRLKKPIPIKMLEKLLRRNLTTTAPASDTNKKPNPQLHHQHHNHHSHAAILNLEYILSTVMQELHPLNYSYFVSREISQPLRIVSSCISNMTSFVLSKEKNHYHDLPSFLACLKASMLVPGITDTLMSISSNASSTPKVKLHQGESQQLQLDSNNISDSKSWTWPKVPSLQEFRMLFENKILAAAFFGKNDTITLNTTTSRNDSRSWSEWSKQSTQQVKGLVKDIYANKRFLQTKNLTCSTAVVSPTTHNQEINSASVDLCDALLCEPIPYRSAVRDEAKITHIVVIRSKPDPCTLLDGKGPGLYELIIAKRFFQLYKQAIPIDWLLTLQHQRIYAEDILLMNEAADGRNMRMTVNKLLQLPGRILDEESTSNQLHILPITPLTTTVNISVAARESHPTSLLGTTNRLLKSAMTSATAFVTQQTSSLNAPSTKKTSKDTDHTVREIDSLEMRRKVIIQAMQGGARRVIDLFLPSIVDHVLSCRDKNISLTLFQSKEKQRVVNMIEAYWKEICEMNDIDMSSIALHENNTTAMELRGILINKLTNDIVSQLIC